MYREARRYKEASPPLDEAVSLTRDASGSDDWLTLQATHELALLRYVTGRWPESEALLLQCLSVAKKIHLDDDHPDVIATENDLGELYSDWGRPTDAENYLRQSLQGYRRYMNGDSTPLVDAMANLAAELRKQQKFEEAEQLGLEAIETARKATETMTPAGMSWSLGDTHGYVARTYEAMGRFDDAERHFRESYEMIRVLAEDDPYGVVSSRVHMEQDMARIALKRGALDLAESFYRESIDGILGYLVMDYNHHENHNIDWSIDGLAQVYENRGDPERVVSFRREVLERVRARVAQLETHREGEERNAKAIAVGHRTIGKLLCDLGEYSQAEEILQQSVRELADAYDTYYSKTVTAREYLATLYTRWSKPEKAAEVLSQNTRPSALGAASSK